MIPPLERPTPLVEEIKLTKRQQYARLGAAILASAGSILLVGLPFLSHNVRDQIRAWWHQFRSGEIRVVLAESDSLKEAHQSIHRVAHRTLRQEPATNLTQENFPLRMQEIVTNYYAKPFPHKDDIFVEHKGKEVLWSSLSTEEKFAVVYEHSLPHNRQKLLVREKFKDETSWLKHIEERLFRGSHQADGKPVDAEKLDPRLDHGSDHGMRVGLFSAVFAWLYNKYDPRCTVEADEYRIIMLAGAFHDSGRQTEGVDVDDKRSAQNAAENMKKWGIQEHFVAASYEAIHDKDSQDLVKKSLIAKSVQCADSAEYGRVGTFNAKYLDIHQEFLANEMPLKAGRTREEFSRELQDITKEMQKLMSNTSTTAARNKFAESENYFLEIVKVIALNPALYPKINAILDEIEHLPAQKTSTRTPLFPTALDDVKLLSGAIGGTTGAKLVQDAQGHKFVQKTARDDSLGADRLRAEYYANKAYKAMGVHVPDVMLYNRVTSQHVIEGTKGAVSEKPEMLSRFIAGNTQTLEDYLGSDPKNSPRLQEVQEKLQKYFVLDCLLANWDVIGLKFDNILVDRITKEFWRIDNGGSLDFRAQGAPKGNLFSTEVGELATMRNADINANAALLFGTITDEEIIRQIDEILANRDKLINALPSKYKAIMNARLDSLIAFKKGVVA